MILKLSHEQTSLLRSKHHPSANLLSLLGWLNRCYQHVQMALMTFWPHACFPVSPILGKNTPSTRCISRTVDMVPDIWFSLPSYTRTSSLANFTFYFSALSTSFHLHCPHLGLNYSHFCPTPSTENSSCQGHQGGHTARNLRQGFSAHPAWGLSSLGYD